MFFALNPLELGVLRADLVVLEAQPEAAVLDAADAELAEGPLGDKDKGLRGAGHRAGEFEAGGQGRGRGGRCGGRCCRRCACRGGLPLGPHCFCRFERGHRGGGLLALFVSEIELKERERELAGVRERERGNWKRAAKLKQKQIEREDD